MNRTRAMHRVRTIAVIICALAVMAGPSATPASATPGAGGIEFRCTASLPNFPASTGAGGTCNGIASGAVVTAGGRVTNFSNKALTSSFSYYEPFASCPLSGSARGIFSISGIASGSFAWDRVGGTALMTLTDVNGSGLTSATGVGLALFIAPTAPGHCLDGGGPLTAIVEGHVDLADSN